MRAHRAGDGLRKEEMLPQEATDIRIPRIVFPQVQPLSPQAPPYLTVLSVYRSWRGLAIPSVGHRSEGYFCRMMSVKGLRLTSAGGSQAAASDTMDAP